MTEQERWARGLAAQNWNNGASEAEVERLLRQHYPGFASAVLVWFDDYMPRSPRVLRPQSTNAGGQFDAAAWNIATAKRWHDRLAHKYPPGFVPLVDETKDAAE